MPGLSQPGLHPRTAAIADATHGMPAGHLSDQLCTNWTAQGVPALLASLGTPTIRLPLDTHL